MACCGGSNKKSRGSRTANVISINQNKAVSESLENQLRLQNGQSITPIRKKRYSPQYRFM
jgi:hypothetical protein